MSSATTYTPLETLLLFQSLAKHGTETNAFARISELLRGNSLIRQGKTFDLARLRPDALKSLYEDLLQAEERSQVTNDGSLSIGGEVGSTAVPNSTKGSPKKRKIPSPTLPSIRNAAQNPQHLPRLIDRLYTRYRAFAVGEIREEEQRYDSLRRDILHIERGSGGEGELGNAGLNVPERREDGSRELSTSIQPSLDQVAQRGRSRSADTPPGPSTTSESQRQDASISALPADFGRKIQAGRHSPFVTGSGGPGAVLPLPKNTTAMVDRLPPSTSGLTTTLRKSDHPSTPSGLPGSSHDRVIQTLQDQRSAQSMPANQHAKKPSLHSVDATPSSLQVTAAPPGLPQKSPDPKAATSIQQAQEQRVAQNAFIGPFTTSAPPTESPSSSRTALASTTAPILPTPSPLTTSDLARGRGQQQNRSAQAAAGAPHGNASSSGTLETFKPSKTIEKPRQSPRDQFVNYFPKAPIGTPQGSKLPYPRPPPSLSPNTPPQQRGLLPQRTHVSPYPVQGQAFSPQYLQRSVQSTSPNIQDRQLRDLGQGLPSGERPARQLPGGRSPFHTPVQTPGTVGRKGHNLPPLDTSASSTKWKRSVNDIPARSPKSPSGFSPNSAVNSPGESPSKSVTDIAPSGDASPHVPEPRPEIEDTEDTKSRVQSRTRGGRRRGRASVRSRASRAGSTASSALQDSLTGRTRSQSLASHPDELSMDSGSLGIRKVKDEHPPSPAGFFTAEDATGEAESTAAANSRSRARNLRDGGSDPRNIIKRKRSIDDTPDRSHSFSVEIEVPSRLFDARRQVPSTRNFPRTSAPLLNEVGAHKFASIFAHPVKEKDAPGYSDLIYQPQDLKSIKAAIIAGGRAVTTATTGAAAGTPSESAASPGPAASASSPRPSVLLVPATDDVLPPKGIVNSAQLEKEVMRMFANAVMFNPDPGRGFGDAGGAALRPDDDESAVVRDVREMCGEVQRSLEDWRAAESAADPRESVKGGSGATPAGTGSAKGKGAMGKVAQDDDEADELAGDGAEIDDGGPGPAKRRRKG
ncbi:MAG: hypothetical protein M1833_006765 [Piccolia ochrophora]|nr:MAG: hypothetical protein M1833_006765 [Piccolia ochrophora]